MNTEKKIKQLPALLLAVLLIIPVCSEPAARKDQLRQLFNGQDLNGWKQAGPGRQ
jgi:hypothetical protein